MDDVRVQVNEELMDAQAARIDDLERRQKEVLTRLSHLSPERLEELVRHKETSTGRPKRREAL